MQAIHPPMPTHLALCCHCRLKGCLAAPLKLTLLLLNAVYTSAGMAGGEVAQLLRLAGCGSAAGLLRAAA
jgi:hypothetical protein